jgi:cytochrome c biogenesis protein CcmG, thiol:disulfide interchange protein DsbE
MTFAPHWSSPSLAFIAALWLVSGSAAAVTVGEMAPSFALPTAEATTIELERLRGQVVYVDFWASWCGPCRRSFPWMSELQQRYRDRGLTVVAINVDAKREDAARFLREFPATFAVVYDGGGTTPRAYGVKAMPSSFIVDTRGRIVAIESGFHEDRRAAIEETIRSLITRP